MSKEYTKLAVKIAPSWYSKKKYECKFKIWRETIKNQLTHSYNGETHHYNKYEDCDLFLFFISCVEDSLGRSSETKESAHRYS